MKRTSSTIIAFLTLLALTAGISAQSPKKILAKATKALGKKSTIKAINSWRKSGLIIRDSDGLSGNFLVQATKPGLYNRQFDIAGFENEVGFNGRSGWVRDSRSGLSTYTGKIGDDFRAEVDYRVWRWVDYKKLKARIIGTGTAEVNGRPASAILMVSAKGVPVKMYFDQSTNLLVREDIRSGEELVQYEYSDYRPVNGVKEPFEMKMNMDGQKYTVRFDRVVHNLDIEQSEFDFPRLSNRPLPDIPKLLADLQANQDEIERILEDYSYKQQTIKRELSSDGKLVVTETETVQLSFYEGYRIQRLIAKNGKPLSPQDQADADKDAQKRVREIEKKLAKENRTVDQTGSGTPDADGRRISIAEVLKASKLTNPRRERLKGRDVVVFDFEPNPEFDSKNAKSFLKFFGKTVGVMWIDEKDKQVARIEAVLADSYKIAGGLLAKLRKGASFTLEQDRVNDEIWLPTKADINLSVRVLLFGGVKVNQIVRSFDYEKFRTEVREAKVDEIIDQ
ncbi:MAG: hypothetical protein OEQ28_09075 [Acidobacteriota bacterium]|nr:hypothetical protein [Acidobacteriota bacterium]